MTSTTPAVQILKTDVLGRVRTPRARREEILDELERSGVSGVEFAELIGVKYPTLACWVQARRRARGEYPALGGPATAEKGRRQTVAPPHLQLVEAVVERSAGVGLRLELPGGARLEILDAAQAALAAALLRALAQEEQSRC